MKLKIFIFVFCILTLCFSVFIFANEKPTIHSKISACANDFLGTPYDPNPIGQYVDDKVIVYDDKVDCMYLVFRCVELALADSKNNTEVKIALEKRFKTKGILDSEDKVVNYQDRFSYGYDMITSPKWGVNVTEAIGKTTFIFNDNHTKKLSYVPIKEITVDNFQNGDIIFFVKAVEDQVENEIIGHLGLIEVSENGVYMIHASGLKKPDTDGYVKKVLLSKYLSQSKFIGVSVKRIIG